MLGIEEAGVKEPGFDPGGASPPLPGEEGSEMGLGKDMGVERKRGEKECEWIVGGSRWSLREQEKKDKRTSLTFGDARGDRFGSVCFLSSSFRMESKGE